MQIHIQPYSDEAFGNMRFDITLGPGLGLYLDSVHFDGYNQKQQRLMKSELKQKRKACSSGDNVSQKVARIEEVGTTSLSQSTLTSINAIPEVKDNVESTEQIEEDSVHELLEWTVHSVPSLAEYKTNNIRQHIFAEEEKTLQYLYFLDYLRAYPSKWSNTYKCKDN